MLKDNFQIDVEKIKISSSEEDSISKTIEELLSLNDLIPKRTDEEVLSITEKQVEERDYMNKSSRGEKEEITERQFEKRDGAPENIIENRFEEKGNAGKHHGEEEVANLKDKGHESVPPIWIEVYKKEKNRNKKDMEKKLKDK